MSNFVQYGSCQCQSIRYKITDEPLFTHVCCCSLCQKRTGSAFGVTVLAFVDDFEIIAGKPEQYKKATGSGTELSIFTCASCHDNLYATHPGFQGVIMTAGGTYDDPSWVKPQAAIFTENKQAWFNLPDDVPVFPAMYELEDTWPGSSLEKLAKFAEK